MQYPEMIKRVKSYNGFSEKEADKALHLFAKKLAARLTDGERKDFASQLPTELKEVVLSADQADTDSLGSFYDEFSMAMRQSKPYAKVQVHAVWEVLKDALAEGQVRDVKAQLPKKLVEELG